MIEKYLKHVRKEGDCLIWTRCVNSDGYPRAVIDGNPNGKVHRQVFILTNGYSPKVVRHTCDNPRCINPNHLLGGDMTSNMKDRSDRGRTHMHVTEEEKAEIKHLRSVGMTHKEIANHTLAKPKRIEYVLRLCKED